MPKTGMKKAVIGGYISFTAGELATLCALRKAKVLSFAALRVYLACHEIKAKRCQAKKQIRYTVAEIIKLLKTGAGEQSVRKALRELETLGLLSFSERHISYRKNHVNYFQDMRMHLLSIFQILVASTLGIISAHIQ